MKPAPFAYCRPATLQQALELMTEHGADGKVLAGGQSLVPILNMRLSSPKCLIDINRISELDYIRCEDDWLKIGALTRQRAVETSPIVREACPILSEAIPYIGHLQTRNRGTVGGSLVHADPTAELPLTLLALDAKVVIQSLQETREVNLQDFFVTFLTTDLMPEELLTEVKWNLATMPRGYAFAEYSRRHGDFALVAAACLMDVEEDGVITRARLTLGGVDAVPILAEAAMNALYGKVLDQNVLAEAARLAAANVDPESDLQASREYRLHLVEVFAKRTIQTAYQRAVSQKGGT
ncbi:MAG TPA: xanthine dehydrogenase family protein subunit M [Alicyclobacillus sp.]|nr:xanthine dehydrogenase family protein subunit M [Alicyclobacillus sp.]